MSDLAMAVRSLIFCDRSAQKVENGHTGRIPVVLGQAKRVTDYIHTLDNKLGKGTKEAASILRNAAENDKLIEYAGKFVKFAERNVNPLICVSSGIDVLTSDDKKSALVTNATALGSMFTVEHLMKKHLDDIPKIKGIDKIAENIAEYTSKYKFGGKLGRIAHGVAFVAGSCAAYSLGEKFGHLLVGKINSERKTVNSK